MTLDALGQAALPRLLAAAQQELKSCKQELQRLEASVEQRTALLEELSLISALAALGPVPGLATLLEEATWGLENIDLDPTGLLERRERQEEEILWAKSQEAFQAQAMEQAEAFLQKQREALRELLAKKDVQEALLLSLQAVSHG